VRNRKAVMDLPLRLTVVMLVISLTVPMALSVMQEQESAAAKQALERSAQGIINAAITVHYGGTGSMRSLTVDLPSGCMLEIGGPEGSTESYSIRCYFHGNLISIRYLEAHNLPLVSKDPLCIEGFTAIILESVAAFNGGAVEVSVR